MRSGGDFGKLAKLIQRVKNVAAGVVGRGALKAMAATSLELARRGASAGTNPQGRAWKPLKRGGVALRWLPASLRLKVGVAQFEVSSTRPFSRFHQYGARKAGHSGPLRPGQRRRKGAWRLPIRRTTPSATKKLPKPWGDSLRRAAVGAWTNTMKG